MFLFSASFVIICQSENTVVLNLLVFVCVKGLRVLFKFLSSCFSSAARPETWTDVDLCSVGQIYADLQHYVETESLAVWVSCAFTVSLRPDPSGGGDSFTALCLHNGM